MSKITTQNKNIRVALINPWTQAITDNKMSWNDIYNWCNNHVHYSDHPRWLRLARRAYNAGDGTALGKMIIGS